MRDVLPQVGDGESEPGIPDRFDPDAIGLEFGERPPADAPRSGLRAQRADLFLAEEIAEPRWLAVDIVPENSIGFIGGAPKVFKSWLALDLAMAVAAGGAFCGRFLCPEPRSVVLVQFESGRAHYQRRVRSIATRYAPVPAELYIVSNEAVLFEDPVSVQRVGVTLGELRPDLVVLDPMAAMTTGEENSATEMGRVIRQLRAWRDQYGCAIAVVHHTKKAQTGPGPAARSGDRLRGSSAFYAAAEWALWVDRADDAASRIEIQVMQKESEARRPFAVEFTEASAELRVVADEISVQVTDDELLEAVAAHKGRRASAQDLAADTGLSERTVRERMAYLVGRKRAYLEEGSGRGRKPIIYVVTKTSAAPRLLSALES